MKLREIVQRISEEKPDILGRVPQGKALTIVREVLGELKKEIEATEEGKIVIPGVGTFVISSIEKKGKKIKRIVFRSAKKKE
uniref:HU family DNA-binding protein n=1 Tax=Thermodesulfobacterium geofontis TaxID=1295609 RepID=A0A7V5XHR1_9BACT